MKKGKISKTGYRKNSPDRFNDYNIIPSGKISMKDVEFPVLGIDNLGNQILMMPDQDYAFPGDEVTEYPMMQIGGEEPFITQRDTIYDPKMLAKFPLRNGKGPKYLLQDKSTNYIKKEKEKGVLDYVDDIMSAPQRAAVYALTGKYENPSKALGINEEEHPWLAMGTDMLLDPTNLLGIGLAKSVSKVAKVPEVIAKAPTVKKIKTIKDLKAPELYEYADSYKKIFKNKDIYKNDFWKHYDDIINSLPAESFIRTMPVEEARKTVMELSKTGAGIAIINDLIHQKGEYKSKNSYKITPVYDDPTADNKTGMTKTSKTLNVKKQLKSVSVPPIPIKRAIANYGQDNPPWKEKGAISFEPNTTNLSGGKGQYVYYDINGYPKVITKDEYDRQNKLGTPKFQKGGTKPIIVNDPNDPRLRAYNDSLSLYNLGEKAKRVFNQDIEPLLRDGHKKDAERLWSGSNPDSFINLTEKEASLPWNRLTKLNKKAPVGESHPSKYDSLYGYNTFKKPVQPVVYQKPESIIDTTKGKLKGKVIFDDGKNGAIYNAKIVNKKPIEPKITKAQANVRYEQPPIFEITMPTGDKVSKKDFVKQYGEAAWNRATGKFQDGGSFNLTTPSLKGIKDNIPNVPVPYGINPYTSKPFATGAIEESMSPLDLIGGIKGLVTSGKGVVDLVKAMKSNPVNIGNATFELGKHPKAIERAMKKINSGVIEIVKPNSFQDGGESKRSFRKTSKPYTTYKPEEINSEHGGSISCDAKFEQGRSTTDNVIATKRDNLLKFLKKNTIKALDKEVRTDIAQMGVDHWNAFPPQVPQYNANQMFGVNPIQMDPNQMSKQFVTSQPQPTDYRRSNNAFGEPGVNAVLTGINAVTMGLEERERKMNEKNNSYRTTPDYFSPVTSPFLGDWETNKEVLRPNKMVGAQYQGFKEGGEVYLTQEEINDLLRNGGQIEYLD